MKIRIRKAELISFMAIFFVLLYSFTKAGIQNWIYPNSIFCYASFLIALGCIYSMIGKKDNLFSSYQVFFLMLCLIVVLFNRNQNIKNGSYEDAISFLFITLFFILALQTHRWHIYFGKLMVFFGMFHAVVTIMEFLFPSLYINCILPAMPKYAYKHLSSVFRLGYIPGLAVHYSTNGMYLSVGLIAAAIFYLLKIGNKGRNTFFMLVIAVALLLTGKRGVVIFSIISILFSFDIYNCDRPQKRREKMFMLILGGVVLFIIGCQFVPELANFVIRFQQTAEAGDITLGRLDNSVVAIELFKKNALFGIGWDAFKYYYQGIYGTLLNVHNVYVQVLAENGLFGAVPFYAFFIISFVRAVKYLYVLRKSRIKSSERDLFLAISIAMQVLFLLYCLTGNPLYDQQIFYPYICAIASGEYYIRNKI